MQYIPINLTWTISWNYLVFWLIVAFFTYVFGLFYLKCFTGKAYCVFKKWLILTFAFQLVFFVFHFISYYLVGSNAKSKSLWFLLSNMEIVGVGFAVLMVLYVTGPMLYFCFNLLQYGKDIAKSKLADYSNELEKHPFKNVYFAFYFTLFFMGFLTVYYCLLSIVGCSPNMCLGH